MSVYFCKIYWGANHQNVLCHQSISQIYSSYTERTWMEFSKRSLRGRYGYSSINRLDYLQNRIKLNCWVWLIKCFFKEYFFQLLKYQHKGHTSAYGSINIMFLLGIALAIFLFLKCWKFDHTWHIFFIDVYIFSRCFPKGAVMGDYYYKYLK